MTTKGRITAFALIWAIGHALMRAFYPLITGAVIDEHGANEAALIIYFWTLFMLPVWIKPIDFTFYILGAEKKELVCDAKHHWMKTVPWWAMLIFVNTSYIGASWCYYQMLREFTGAKAYILILLMVEGCLIYLIDALIFRDKKVSKALMAISFGVLFLAGVLSYEIKNVQGVAAMAFLMFAGYVVFNAVASALSERAQKCCGVTKNWLLWTRFPTIFVALIFIVGPSRVAEIINHVLELMRQANETTNDFNTQLEMYYTYIPIISASLLVWLFATRFQMLKGMPLQLYATIAPPMSVLCAALYMMFWVGKSFSLYQVVLILLILGGVLHYALLAPSKLYSNGGR